MATHGTPLVGVARSRAAATKTTFWSASVDWKLIKRIAVIIITVMVVIYAAGVCLNDGPSMNYLGWVYITRWGEMPTQVGQIIRLVPADKPVWTKWLPRQSWVKRISGFTPEGLVKFEGDNPEWSKDNRDGLKPVSKDHIAGTVSAAISLPRLIRQFTARGKLENWAEFHYPPKKYIVTDKIVAVIHNGKFSVYDSHKTIDIGPAFDYSIGALLPVEYRNGRFVFRPDAERSHVFSIFDPNAKGVSRYYSFDALKALPLSVELSDSTTPTQLTLKPGAVLRVKRETSICVGESPGSSMTIAEVDGIVHRVPMDATFRVRQGIKNLGTDVFIVRRSG